MNKQITVAELVELLEEMAPPSLAEKWDNMDLMQGRRAKDVHKIMLALDMTRETVEQAIEYRADMLITHHPAIFKRLPQITDGNWQQELLLQLAEHGIAVYSAHTNLDCVSNGVNDALVKRLGIVDEDILDNSNGLGRIGYVKECSLEAFAKHVKQALHADYVAVGDGGRRVQRVALCGGAGSDLIEEALRQNADTLVTGDVKYHGAQRAVFGGLSIIDAGHQCTEWPVLEDLADRLSLRFAEKDWNITLKVAKESLLLKHV